MSKGHNKRHMQLLHAAFGLIAVMVVVVMIVARFRDPNGSQQNVSRERLDPVALQAMSRPADRERVARQWGRERREDAAPLLRLYLKDADPRVREACAWALGEIEAATAILALKERLTDSEPAVRVAAVEAIGKLARARKLPDAYPMLTAVLRETDEAMSLAAVRAFAVMDGGDASDGLALALGSHQSEPVRLAALEAATKRDDAGVAKLLMKSATDRSVALRRIAVQELTRRTEPDFYPALARATLDEDAGVREMARQAALKIGPAILSPLRQEISRAQTSASVLSYIEMLNALKPPDLVTDLFRLFDNETPAITQNTTALTARMEAILAEQGADVLPKAIEATVLDESHPAVEQLVARYCVRIGSPAARAITEALLRWKLFPDVGELAMWVRTLGEIGDPLAAPALTFALSQDKTLASTVEEARRQIEAKSGRPFAVPAPVSSFWDQPVNQDILRAQVLPAPQPFGVQTAWNGLPDNGVVRLILDGAVFHYQKQRGKGVPLTVYLVRRNGRWETDLRGSAIWYNKRMPFGRLVEAHTDEKTMTFKIEMAVPDDSFVMGGWSEYTIRIQPDNVAASGRFTGHFNYLPAEGPVSATSWTYPVGQRRSPPLGVNEHPRLLFRPHQIPAIRERLKTPFGRQVFEVLRARATAHKLAHRQPVDWVRTWNDGVDMAIANGFVSLMFDDPLLGRRGAMALVKRAEIPPYPGEHGERLPEPLYLYAFGYDMAYQSLTDAEREKLIADIGGFHGIYTYQRGMMGDLSAHAGLVGIMAMTLYNDKGPFQWPEPKPPPPVASPSPLPVSDPPSSVPVAVLEPMSMPTQWLMAGPFDLDGQATHPLDPLGGPAAASPQEGTAVPFGGLNYRFLPIPDDVLGTVAGESFRQQYIRIPATLPTSVTYLYNITRVTERLQVRLADELPFMPLDNRIWINGVPTTSRTALRLEPGLYRVMIEVTGHATSPYWAPAPSDLVQAQNRSYQLEHAAWQRHQDEATATGVMTRIARVVEDTRRTEQEKMERYSDRPFNHHNVHLALAAACWNVFEEPLYYTMAISDMALTGESIEKAPLRTLIFTLPLLPPEPQGRVVRELRNRITPEELAKLSSRELVALLAFWPVEELDR